MFVDNFLFRAMPIKVPAERDSTASEAMSSLCKLYASSRPESHLLRGRCSGPLLYLTACWQVESSYRTTIFDRYIAIEISLSRLSTETQRGHVVAATQGACSLMTIDDPSTNFPCFRWRCSYRLAILAGQERVHLPPGHLAR